MTDGYDHDFEVPPAAFRTAFSNLALRWPEGLAELDDDTLIPLADLAEHAPDTLGEAFGAYRDIAARARFHQDGGFVDADGESPLTVFLVECDKTRLTIDLVFDVEVSPVFSLAVHEAIGRGIAEALRSKPSSDWTPMDEDWLARTLDVLRLNIPDGAVNRESGYFIALACWHRVRFEDTPKLMYTQPPGRLKVVNGRLEFVPDDAGLESKVRPWGFEV